MVHMITFSYEIIPGEDLEVYIQNIEVYAGE